MPMRALENYSENAPKSINFTIEINFIHINFTHKRDKKSLKISIFHLKFKK